MCNNLFQKSETSSLKCAIEIYVSLWNKSMESEIYVLKVKNSMKPKS